VADSAFHRIIPLAELKPGRTHLTVIGGQEVLLCNTGDTVHAVSGLCTHAVSRLDEGRLRGHRLTCLLHGASFDVRSGKVMGGPACEPLRSYPTRVTQGYIEVQA
jgi:3-phenylpropionate/trans-cinnamate dioxygenase ferredoxin subunit